MEINIANLYPDMLNLYGDKGNVATLCYRMKKRNIDVTVTDYSGDSAPDFESCDILYIGGGPEGCTKELNQLLCKHKQALKDYIENGGCVLAICNGYRILGNSYELPDETVEGLGLIDITTKKCKKVAGDIILECCLTGSKIAGFENRSVQTVSQSCAPLGKVIYRNGEICDGETEGVVYKNLIGTSVHGPLLPKNAALADYIIKCAITQKYGEQAELTPLDDEFETKANEYIVNKYIK